MGDIQKVTSPVTSVPRKVASFAKEKFIDQKITHREKGKVDDPDYSGIKKSSSSGDIDDSSPKPEIPRGKGGGQMNNQDVAQFYFKEINNLDRFNE
jgi:hypothetical protein